MDVLEEIILGLLFVGIAMIIVAAVIVQIFLGVIIWLFVRRSRRLKELNRAPEPMFCTGTVADLRCAPDPRMFVYFFSLHYPGADGQTHRAFLGIRTPIALNAQVGMPVQLAVFLNPVITPSPSALDPMRGADGMLPPQVELCTWLGRPIDETGTVMFADDYRNAVTQAEKKNKTDLIVGLVLTGILLLHLIGAAVSLLQ